MTKEKKKLTKEERAELRRQRNREEKERQKLFFKELDEAADKMVFDHKCYNRYTVYCPICDERFDGSDYLKTVFKDERSLWLANMVMHYRHDHISSWNKCWGRYGYYYQRAAHFGNYDEEKTKVNERAKRQIVRKCKDYVVSNNINADIFKMLQNTTEETLKVVEKAFNDKK